MSRIRANKITNQLADGSPTVENGLIISGITTSTTFSGSGASLTNLNASNIASGTVPTARLGSGTASSSTFLAGDSTYKTVTGTTINNNADNRIITGSGTANTLEGESVLTFDSSTDTLQVHQQNNGNNPAFKSIHRGGAGSQINAHFTNYSGTNHTVITHDGSVGIGTESPTEKFNVFGTNVKPVIGDRTAHTVHYSGYDSQNNTTLEISSSGTGTNVAGLTLNNPTTAANTSYKTLTFTCSGTSNAEKRGAIITSNHDAASGSAIKGNLTTMVNNGTQLQTAMFIGHQGHVTKAHTAMFSARGQGSWNQFNSGSGWYNLGDSSYSGSNYYQNHGWTTSGGGCGVRGATDAGNSIWENDKARFTAPVAGFYFFEISLYIRTFNGGDTFHVQPWLDSTNLNYYTSNISIIRDSSNNNTGHTQQYPNSVMRSIVIYMAANQQFRWVVYSGNNVFETHYDYAHQSGYLIG